MNFIKLKGAFKIITGWWGHEPRQTSVVVAPNDHSLKRISSIFNVPRLNKVSKAALIFMMVSALQFLSSFLLLPLYLHIYSVEEFGINEIINRVSLFAGFIISLRISGAMANVYFSFKDSTDKKTFISSIAIFTIITSIAGLVLFLFFGSFIIDLFFANTGFLLWPHGFCAFITGITGNIMLPYIFHLRNEQKLKDFFIINIFFIALTLITQLAAIYIFKANFRQLVYTRSFVAVFQIAIMLFIYCTRFSLKVNWLMIKRALSYTIPLIPFLVLNWLQLYYDRFFISHYYGAISLGIFSFIVIISAIHNAFTDVFENTFRPSFMHNFINAGSEPDSMRRTQNQYLLSIAFSASFILLCSLALPLITKNERYLEHAGLFFLALASTVCKGISLLFIQQLVFREKSVLLGTIVFVHFILTWLCYTHLAIQGSIDQVLVINLALNFVMTGVYFKLAQMVFPVLIKASQVLIPYAYIGLLFASYLLLINGILVLSYLVILQFIILAIACLWFGKKHSLNLSNALSK